MGKASGGVQLYGVISEAHSSPEGHGYAALLTIIHIERSMVNKEAAEAHEVAIKRRSRNI